jgi:hypothetical protein
VRAVKTAALIGEYLEPMRKMSFEAAQRLNGEFGIPWPAFGYAQRQRL